MRFHSIFFICAILFPVFIFAADDVVMSRRTIDRSNLFKSGDFSFSVTTDERSPSGWSIKALKGTEERIVPVSPTGVTRLFFPGDVFEIRNDHLPRGEHWSTMQETIGEFEIVRRSPSDFFKDSPVRTSHEKTAGYVFYVFGNGVFTLKMLPAFNGAIYSLTDSVSGIEFFCGRLEGAQGKNSFEKLGFLELVNRYGQTAGVEFEPGLEPKPSGRNIVKMEKELPDGRGAKLSRTIELEPGLPQVKIRSVLTASGAPKNAFRLKHRPEATFVGCPDNRSISIFTEKNGVWKERTTPSGEVIPKGLRYALVDRDRGFLFGVTYAEKDLEQLYLWNARDYVTLEAWSVERPLVAPLELEVRYYLIRGMSRANFLGTDGALFIPDLHPVIHAGSPWKMALVYGSASSWVPLEIEFTIKNRKGETVLSEKRTLSAPVPGFAAPAAYPVLPTEKLVPGVYEVGFALSKGGISGKIPLTIVSPEQLQESRALLDRILTQIEIQRKAYRDLLPEKKKQALREFKRNLMIRDECEEALKNGDLEKFRTLSKEFK